MANSETQPDTLPTSSASPVTNIYLIYSPMHYLTAESIAVHFEQNARNCLFFLKPAFKELVDPTKWDSAEFLPWPRFYPEKGFLGKLRRTIKNLDLVANACKGASEIRLHTPTIDTEAVNYFINYLRTTYSDALFTVRIIPDGFENIQRFPLSRFKVALQYCKKIRRLIHPDLNYYVYTGDRMGTDTDIVDRIYIIQGFPHEYSATKTVALPPLGHAGSNSEDVTSVTKEKLALVIGQPMASSKRFTLKELVSVTSGIRELIAANGIECIEYKAHPSDSDRELSHPDYKELKISMPLETYLASTHFDLIIGVFSTALLTARLIQPQSCRIIAYATELIKYRGHNEKENLLSTFVTFGVEIVPHLTKIDDGAKQ